MPGLVLHGSGENNIHSCVHLKPATDLDLFIHVQCPTVSFKQDNDFQ